MNIAAEPGAARTSINRRPDSFLRRASSITIWAVLSLSLVALLFIKLDISLGDIGLAFRRTPPWLFALIILLTLSIQALASYRWQVAIEWLSPHASRIGFLDLLKATTFGTALGQVLPLQVSLSLGRWWSTREMRGKWIVGTTLYEQLFDLVVLCAGGIGALFVLFFTTSPTTSIAAFVIAVAGGSLGVRYLFSIGHMLAARLARSNGLGSRLGARIAGPLETARKAPTRVLFLLSATSIAKLFLLVLRTVFVAAIFAPDARLWTVAAGYPLVGLAIANPVMPGGLGVAEWSWTGLLVLAGSAASIAGVAAILLRILNLTALGIILVVLAGLKFARRRA